MLNKKSVDDINVKGQKVLVRCDFNVPLQDGKITDENRLVAALPTIKKLIADGGKVILCSHLGKPKGEPKPELSLAPVAVRLSELLGQEVKFAADPEVVGPNAKAAVAAMKDGDVVLLENTRYRAEETKNEDKFSEELASLCDVFVNDAFGGSIRTGRCRSEVLMQEEVTQKTIALVIKTAKLDANVLKAAMRMYLNHRRQKAQKTHGKTSVKKLVGEGVGVSSIEVTDGNIKSFERVARKYNVDFAVKKDKTTAPPKYVVFFKGRDADAVAQAFKEFVYGNEKRKSRTSVREKLKRFRDAVSQNKNRERSREKNKDRGQSL